MKKIMSILSLAFLLVLGGCSGYTRDETPGEIKTISVAQMEEKLKNKESFPLVFTQSWCEHCIKMKEMLAEYLPKHHVVLYDVIIDKDPNKDTEGNIAKIQSYFPEMTTTPSLYYVKDGKLENELENGDEGITEDKFDSWVQNYQLDKKS